MEIMSDILFSHIVIDINSENFLETYSSHDYYLYRQTNNQWEYKDTMEGLLDRDDPVLGLLKMMNLSISFNEDTEDSSKFQTRDGISVIGQLLLQYNVENPERLIHVIRTADDIMSLLYRGLSAALIAVIEKYTATTLGMNKSTMINDLNIELHSIYCEYGINLVVDDFLIQIQDDHLDKYSDYESMFYQSINNKIEKNESIGHVCNIYLKQEQTVCSCNSPLFVGNVYTLCMQIGKYLPISWLDQTTEPFPALGETKTMHKLFVTVSTKPDIHFDILCQVMLLSDLGESDLLEFPFIIQTAVQHSPVFIHIYYEWNIVQIIELTLTTVAKPQKYRRTLPYHHAAIRYTRTRGFTDLTLLPPQDLTISINRYHDSYQLTIAWPDIHAAVSAGIHVDFPIRSTELNMVIGVVRKALYEATWCPSYRIQVNGHLHDQRTSLYNLAVAGNLLYTTLFAPERALPQAHQALTLFREWMATLMSMSATPLPKLQIIHRDIAIGIPWGILYPDPIDEPSMVDYTKFWGCAFQLEVLTPTFAFHLQKRQEPRSPITIQSGVHTFRLAKDKTIVDLTAQHRDALVQLTRSHTATIDFYERANSTLLRAMVQNTDILYMFCHGHTARSEGDLVDWSKLLQDHLYQLPPEVQARYRDLIILNKQHPLFAPNESDSWLKWTESLIPLRLLKQWLVGLPMLHQPLVILNMCESAQVLPSFEHGFIPFFSQVGARGIVGTECPIVAPFAAAFAEELIEALLQGRRIGEILPTIRRKFIEEHRNPLGLAYTYYGDAELQIVQKPHVAS